MSVIEKKLTGADRLSGHVVADDAVWKAIRKKLIEMQAQDAHVKVGVLASKGGDELHEPASFDVRTPLENARGEPARANRTPITLIELAAIHEFGSPAANIPERSFIRRTFREKTDELHRVTLGVAKRFLEDKITLFNALNILGTWGANAVKRTIRTGPGVPPPLKPATIKAKGSSRPLVDTGRLLNALTWEVFGK